MFSVVERINRFARRRMVVQAVDVALSVMFYLSFALAVLVLVENLAAEMFGNAPFLTGTPVLLSGLACVCLVGGAAGILVAVFKRPPLYSVAKLLDDSLGTEDRLLTCVELEDGSEGDLGAPKRTALLLQLLLQHDAFARIAPVVPARIFPVPRVGRRWTSMVALAALGWATLGLSHQSMTAPRQARYARTAARLEQESLIGRAGSSGQTQPQPTQHSDSAKPETALFIRLDEPKQDTTVARGTQVRITWVTGCPKDTSLILWLSLDSDRNIENGVLSPLAVFLPGKGEMLWNTKNVAPGSYYICGQAHAGTSTTAYSFAPGSVTVTPLGRGAPGPGQGAGNPPSTAPATGSGTGVPPVKNHGQDAHAGSGTGVPPVKNHGQDAHVGSGTGVPPVKNHGQDAHATIASPGKGNKDNISSPPPFGDPERFPAKRKQFFVEPLFDETGAAKTVKMPAGENEQKAPDAPRRSGETRKEEAFPRIPVPNYAKTLDSALRRGTISVSDYNLVKAYFERLNCPE